MPTTNPPATNHDEMEYLEAINTMPAYQMKSMDEKLEELSQKQGGKGENGEDNEDDKSDNPYEDLEDGPKKMPKYKPSRKDDDGEMQPNSFRATLDPTDTYAKIRAHLVDQAYWSGTSEKAKFMNDDFYFGDPVLTGYRYEPPLPKGSHYYRKKIANSMIDNQFDREIYNQRRGKLNFSSLYKSVTGSDRVFKKKEEAKNKNYTFGFLYDHSGSMSGENANTMINGIYTLHYLFHKLEGIRLYEAYFDTDFRMLNAPYYKTSVDMVMSKYGNRLGGACQDLHIRKTFPNDGNNTDSLAIERLSKYLLHEDSLNKIMFVFCDGQADDHGMVKKQIANLAEKGVRVIGVGIGSDQQVERLYSEYFVVPDVRQLPQLLADKIASIIKRG